MPFTAKNAKIQFSTDETTWTDLPDCRLWQLKPLTDLKRYASSSTAGRIHRLAGNTDVTGHIDFFQNATGQIETSLPPGSTLTLRLYETATRYHQLQSIIETLEYQVDLDRAELVSCRVTFAQSGTYTAPTPES